MTVDVTVEDRTAKVSYDGFEEGPFLGPIRNMIKGVQGEAFLGRHFDAATAQATLVCRTLEGISWEDRAVGERVLHIDDLQTEEREEIEGRAYPRRFNMQSEAPLTAGSAAKLEETIAAETTRDAVRKLAEGAQNTYDQGALFGLDVYQNDHGDHAIIATRNQKVGGVDGVPTRWVFPQSYQFFDAAGHQISRDDYLGHGKQVQPAQEAA